MNVRKLTELEIDAFPGGASVDVAIKGQDGVWYYGDSDPSEDDPTGFQMAQFVCYDDDTEYVPVEKPRVRYGFHGADLFNGWDGGDMQGVDVKASAQRYADKVLAALQERYPEAEIAVPYDLDAGGALPWHFVPAVNDRTDSPEVMFVEATAGDIYEKYDWVVYTDNRA